MPEDNPIEKWLGDFTVTCDLCHAQVRRADMKIHLEWHEKLRRAVDETDILG